MHDTKKKLTWEKIICFWESLGINQTEFTVLFRRKATRIGDFLIPLSVILIWCLGHVKVMLSSCENYINSSKIFSTAKHASISQLDHLIHCKYVVLHRQCYPCLWYSDAVRRFLSVYKFLLSPVQHGRGQLP